MKKIIASITILTSVGLAGCSSTPTTASDQSSSGSIEIANNNTDLKQIPIFGGKVSTDFVLKNNSTDPVTLIQGETSCMCTEAIVKGKDGFESKPIKMAGHGPTVSIDYIIEPGEEATITAVFDPLAHGPNATGAISRDVYLKTNSTTTPELRLTFSGDVVKEKMPNL